MIVIKRRRFPHLCRQRGYTPEECIPSVVSQDGDDWVVDDTHPAYPRRPPAGEKPGTELHRLLSRLWLNEAKGCGCRSHAAQMDRRGCRWCEANMDTIIGWMRKAAKKRGLPFLDAGARVLIRRAIRNARKAVLAPPNSP